MKISTKSRSKKPNCRHFGPDGTPTDKYVVVYVEQPPFGYRPHLHCSECNVTAQNALPKKTAKSLTASVSDQTEQTHALVAANGLIQLHGKSSMVRCVRHRTLDLR